MRFWSQAGDISRSGLAMAVTAPSVSLRVQVNDVTSRISLDSIGGSADAPVLDLALGLKIPLLDLVSLMAEFQQTHQPNGQAPKINQTKAYGSETVKTVELPPAVSAPPPSAPPPGVEPPPPPSADQGARAEASLRQDLKNFGLQPNPRVPAVAWEDEISDLQPNQEEYRGRAKWTVSESRQGARPTWKLGDELSLRNFRPQPLKRTGLTRKEPDAAAAAEEAGKTPSASSLPSQSVHAEGMSEGPGGGHNLGFSEPPTGYEAAPAATSLSGEAHGRVLPGPPPGLAPSPPGAPGLDPPGAPPGMGQQGDPPGNSRRDCEQGVQ